jgi:hypothetical protein
MKASEELLGDLAKMARRWRRQQGGAGGACVQTQEHNTIRDKARLKLIKEVEEFIKESTDET